VIPLVKWWFSSLMRRVGRSTRPHKRQPCRFEDLARRNWTSVANRRLNTFYRMCLTGTRRFATVWGMIKAFAYLRVSGKGQIDGDGFPRQRAAVEAYAKAHGIRIVRYFEEQGVSGTKDLLDRPALQEMLLALLSNGVHTVLIEKLDRLARDLMVQETIIGDFKKRGFEVISVAEPDLCSDDPSRKLVRQVFGAIAEYERAVIVLKLRAARQRIRTKTGHCEGRKPFGFRPEEKKTLIRISELHDQGLNYTATATALNAEGYRTQTGGEWFPTTVSRTLELIKKLRLAKP
jgi:DNA invertase Pin-like site-specific DNA recombinase